MTTNFKFLKDILQTELPNVKIDEINNVDYLDDDGNVKQLHKYRVAVQSYNDALLRINEAIYNMKLLIGEHTHVKMYTGKVNTLWNMHDINNIDVYLKIIE